MIRRPPRSTRTDTLFPYTTLFRSTRARPSRVAQGWRLAQGLSRMASDHERPAKFSPGWQPTALRLTNSRSSSCALGVDPIAVRHMPDIGRASCRERVCQYVEISLVAVAVKKKSTH